MLRLLVSSLVMTAAIAVEPPQPPIKTTEPPLPSVRVESSGTTVPMRWGVLGHSFTQGEDWQGTTQTPPFMWDPATKAIFPGFVPLTHAYPLHWLRMNAGNTYPWKDLIGPVAQRHAQKAQWGGETLVEPGFQELMTWTESLPQPPAVTMVIGPQTSVAEIQEFIGYLNAERGLQAERRAANGHPRPYNVKIFELGNEVDWSGREDVDIMRADSEHEKAGMMRATDYVRIYKPIIAALRAADPGVRLYAQAKTSPWSIQNPKWVDWHRQVISGLGGLIDGITIHPYYDGYPVSMAIGSVDAVIKDLQAFNTTATRPMAVWISEHGKWWGNKLDGQTWGLGGAISTGDFLIEAMERPEVEAATNWAYAHRGPWRVIDRDPKTGRCFGTGIHWLYLLLNRAVLDEVHPLKATMPAGLTYPPGYDYLANAIWFTEAKGSRQSLVAINRSPDRAMILDTTIPLTAVREATRLMVTAEQPGATNTPETPDAVQLGETAAHLVPGPAGTLQVVLPPHCVAAWLWR